MRLYSSPALLINIRNITDHIMGETERANSRYQKAITHGFIQEQCIHVNQIKIMADMIALNLRNNPSEGDSPD